MKCPKCGVENNEKNKFCLKCGTELNTSVEMPQVNENVNTQNNTNEEIKTIEQPIVVGSNNNQQNNDNLDSQIDLNNSVNIVNQTNTNNQQNIQNSLNNVVNVNNQEIINSQANIVNQPMNNTIQSNQLQQNELNVVNNINNTQLNDNLGEVNKNNVNNHKMPVKIILIVVGVILLMVLSIILIPKLSNSNNLDNSNNISDTSYSYNLFNPDNYIAVEENGLYGYINTKGEMVIDLSFVSAYDFYGSYAIVKYKENDKTLEGIIDKNGNVIKSGKSVEYDTVYNFWIVDSILYDGNLNQVTSEDYVVTDIGYGYLEWDNYSEKKAGIMNYKGDITYTYEYQTSSLIMINASTKTLNPSDDTYCLVDIDDKNGIVNCKTGKVVYDYTDNNIVDGENNIFYIYDNSSISSYLFIENDKIAYQCNKSDGCKKISMYDYGYLTIESTTGSYEHYSFDGNVISSISSTYNSYAAKLEKNYNLTLTNCGESYGLSRNGEELTSCEWASFVTLGVNNYNYLKSIGKDYILGVKDKNLYLIDLNSKKQIEEFNGYDYYNPTNSHLIRIKENDSENKYIIYSFSSNKSMEIESEYSSYIDLGRNYFTIFDGTNTKYYNTDLELIYTSDEKPWYYNE